MCCFAIKYVIFRFVCFFQTTPGHFSLKKDLTKGQKIKQMERVHWVVCLRSAEGGVWGFKAAWALCRGSQRNVHGPALKQWRCRRQGQGEPVRHWINRGLEGDQEGGRGQQSEHKGGCGWGRAAEGWRLRGRDGGINGGGGNYLSGETALKRYSGRIVRWRTEQDTVDSSQPSERWVGVDQIILTEEKI